MTTQYARASYQEIIDLHTMTDKVSVLGIHTPVSDAPYTFLQGFFDSFQKYHYDGCSMSLVPSARLPADISQVSYEAGDIPIDPRDLLNPILWHGAHGESLGAVLNQFYSGLPSNSDVDRAFSDSVDKSEVSQSQLGNDVIWQSLYYRALTDNTWRKAHPQQGLRLNALHPLVYGVGTNAQYLNSQYGNLNPTVPRRGNVPVNPDDAGLSSLGTSGMFGVGGANNNLQMSAQQGFQTTQGTSVFIGPDRSGVQLFSERLHGLGWLDTRVRVLPSSGLGTTTVETTGTELTDRLAIESLYQQVEGLEKINYLPRLFMGVVLLPPAYKAKQYYRLILNHRFSFRKFRGLSMRGDVVGRFGPGSVPGYTNML